MATNSHAIFIPDSHFEPMKRRQPPGWSFWERQLRTSENIVSGIWRFAELSATN
jgi:hypothetical protein